MRINGCAAVYYDLYRPEITANPYLVFRRLREEVHSAMATNAISMQ
jgi:hypothetical protein